MFKKRFPSLSSLGSDGNTAFLRAARAGHLDKVLEHLRANIDINTSNSNGLNALHLASKDGHVAVVTELLKRGAVVDAATKKGNTALHIASLAGQEEVVKLLVANGAAVNVQSQNGFTPLYMAAQENHDNVVRFLLANGANQSLATEDGFTPLAVAMQQGHDKVVAVLLENDTRGKVRLPALHIAAKKDDCKAAALLLQNDHNPDVTSKSGFTPLHIAAHYGNESIANLLLNRGADVNYSAKHNITPLHVAAKWGKTNMVSLLLSKGANIESKTRDGLTPLHCAARSGHEQVVDMMLERGAPISCKTKNGLAPLHMASQGDHVDAARILLYHRAPVDEVTVDYLTALHVAAHCGHVRVAKLLLDRKADPNARALNGFTPLHIACKKNRIKVVELLLKHGASIEATTESGLTPLHVASFMGCMNIVIYLLQHDANPDVPTVRGETPLHLAARANQTDIIRILLRNGAQVDARAREQQTPLHIASRLGNVDIVMLLLQHGAAVDSTTKDMYTALHIAGKEGQEEVASVLLEHGASLTATTKKGLTPLHLAAKYGNMKVAKLLLQRDAPVDAQGKNGVTPLHVASHYDHQNVALLLLDKGASPHATAKNGHTPLHIAARKNQMDIATTLLEYGAKANAESKAGFTPLHLSSQEGHTDMSTLLIEHQADTNQKAKNGLTPLHLCAQEDRVNVATILVKNGAQVDSATKAGYTPLHVASHFGQVGMVRFLLQHRSNVAATTALGYTPLHQAAQQGHAPIVNILLENKAPPNVLTNQGQTALSIAHKLGYISVVESLKVVTEAVIPTTAAVTEEKYRVVAPEMMQETFMSDSEDEGGEDTMLSDQPYRYLTVDEMKSLGDDSLPIDVTRDERIDSNRECMAPPTAVDDTISPQHIKDSHSQFAATFTPDNIDISKHPIHIGKLHWKNFLVSFLVDARGGAMRGCRHSGVRVIVPPRRAAMPTRVTCRYLKRDKLTHPPPLMEGEALASRILELGPVGAKFLGPVIIEVPHFGSLRGMEREIVILRSDNGETWREHTTDASDEAVHEVLNESFEGEELSVLEDVTSGRTTRILTNDFPQYFAVVSRIRQEVHAIGPEGGMVSSSVVPQVQAVFPQGALTKKIKVGLQAQPIAAELAAKLLGNRVAVSPIVTVEPRRRKFHKPITLTIPVPQAANKGMINQYSGDAPTLRLLCSITGGTTRAQWEDVTGSTPLTFVNDCVSFTTTVSARFWLMDCRNIGEATKMATELYKEAIHVPFMAKFVVFAKRVDVLEARLRVFCMTDDKEDKTLEHQEHFTEVAKSRDVEVLEGKPQYVEFAGNLVPVTKSGDQLQLGFRAFRENRLPFTVRVKDPHADTVGRILFMREPKIAKGEPPQQPVCILNIVLPETILPESGLSEPDIISLQKKYSFLRDGGIGRPDVFQSTNLRLSDLSNLLAEDWVPLANDLGVNTSDINIIKTEFPSSVAQQAMGMLRLWLQQAGNKATAITLENSLRKIGREDIIQQCIFNADETEKIEKVCDQSGFDSLKEEFGPSRDTSLKRDVTIDMTSYDEQDLMKESESVEELVQAEKKEPIKDSRISTVDIIPKKWPATVKDDEIEETKYIGEEKVVEEERRTVAQLKEIFAQDKRDRQYERQPLIIQEEDVVRRPLTRTTDNESTRPPSTVDEDLSRLSTSTFDDSTIEDEVVKKQTSSPEQSSDEIMKANLDADQRRDSELFQGVSEGLVRLETTHKVMPSTEEILSPKISKTPPPSPAEFKEAAGVATWQHTSLLPTELPAPTQGQTDASKSQDMKTDLASDWRSSQSAEFHCPEMENQFMQKNLSDIIPEKNQIANFHMQSIDQLPSEVKSEILGPTDMLESQAVQDDQIKMVLFNQVSDEDTETQNKCSEIESNTFSKDNFQLYTPVSKKTSISTIPFEIKVESLLNDLHENLLESNNLITESQNVSANYDEMNENFQNCCGSQETIFKDSATTILENISSEFKETDQNLEAMKTTENNSAATEETSQIYKTEPIKETSNVQTISLEESFDFDKLKDAAPYVTTPTLQRRGIGGSQRLSRDQRPPLLDVSELFYDDDDDVDTGNEDEYIVTEPKESKILKSTEDCNQLYRISSSPDILSEQTIPNLSNICMFENKRKPMFHIESEEDDQATDLINDLSQEVIKKDRELATVDKIPFDLGESSEVDKKCKEKNGEKEALNLCQDNYETENFSMAPYTMSIEVDNSENIRADIKISDSSKELKNLEEVDSCNSIEPVIKLMDRNEKKLRRIERRFERMASETMETDTQNNTVSEQEQMHEREFERMLSQLSNEEVAECQNEYSQLWEDGITPSEEWDSHDTETPSGDLNEESPEIQEKQECEGNAEIAIKDTAARDEAEIDPVEHLGDDAAESAESPQSARNVKQETQRTTDVPSIDSNRKEFPR